MQGDDFSQLRDEIEQLVRDHVRYGNGPGTSVDRISRVAELWSHALERGRAALPREEYIAAQRFLTGIKYSTTNIDPNNAVQNIASNGSIVPRPVVGGTLAGK